MAVTSLLYASMPAKMAAKQIDWVADSIKVALVKNTYTPAQLTHVFWSDVVAQEAAGTNYTAGGFALASKAISFNSALKTQQYQAGNLSAASLTVTFRYAVIYDATPSTDATRPLIELVDFGADQVLVNGSFVLTWQASGVFTAAVA